MTEFTDHGQEIEVIDADEYNVTFKVVFRFDEANAIAGGMHKISIILPRTRAQGLLRGITTKLKEFPDSAPPTDQG